MGVAVNLFACPAVRRGEALSGAGKAAPRTRTAGPPAPPPRRGLFRPNTAESAALAAIPNDSPVTARSNRATSNLDR